MIQTFILTIRQLKDPKIVKPLVIASLFTLITIGLCLILGASAIQWIMNSFSSVLFDWFGDSEGWFRIFIHFLGAFFLLILSYFFFASIHAAFLGIFIDDIFDAIAHRHYPSINLRPPMKLFASIIFSTRFVLLSLLLNFVSFPFLLLGWFIPPVGITLQVFLNGYLIGKEYGQLLEFRLPVEMHGEKGKFLGNGMIASLIWMIPVINFIAPVLLAGSILHSKMKSIPTELQA